MRSKGFVQLGKKNDGVSNTAVTDAMCKPVKGVEGVDCTMSGLNVTIEALKNIVTDKPAPLTVPLVHPLAPYTPVAILPIPVPMASNESAPSNASFVGIKFTGDAGEEPIVEKPIALTTPAKEVGNSVYGELVDIEAK